MNWLAINPVLFAKRVRSAAGLGFEQEWADQNEYHEVIDEMKHADMLVSANSVSEGLAESAGLGKVDDR